MPTEIKMPQLGESVTEGTVGRWLKQPGERVAQYEALLEVTTDKVDTEVPAPASGVIREIKVAEGQTVRVGTLLAILDDDAAVRQAYQEGASHTSARTNGTVDPSPSARFSNLPVSPVVARLVAEYHLDISQIKGTGQGGRVTKQDVQKYLSGREVSSPAMPVRSEPMDVPSPLPMAQPMHEQKAVVSSVLDAEVQHQREEMLSLPEDAELLPLSAMRRSIADHMVRSRRTAPHVTTVVEVDVGRITSHRQHRKVDFERQGVKLTFTPYFVQAIVAGLQAVPVVNGRYSDSGVVFHQRIHIGVAVALDEGLIVPVVRDADEKNLLGLSRAVNDLSERARIRRLKPDETQGGTFTITNHGVTGSLFAMPIINQPQAAILGVGAIQKRPVVITQDGIDAIGIRPMCYLSLTFDHRLIDGATADRFLMVVKTFLEDYEVA